jgi:hypothetical protein
MLLRGEDSFTSLPEPIFDGFRDDDDLKRCLGRTPNNEVRRVCLSACGKWTCQSMYYDNEALIP